MMETECIMATLSGDAEPSIPPGFGPFAALASQGIRSNDKEPGDTHPRPVQLSQRMEKDVKILECSSAHCRSSTPASTSGSHSGRKSLRNRPPIDYSQFELTSDEESDVGSVQKAVRSVGHRQQLPKGVLRGCAECADCQKVVARWNPSGARKPVLEDAPVYYPSEEEFKDTLKYIDSIRPMAEPYGICRIVPPPSWKPPCLLKKKDIWECSKFSTRVQKIDKLQNRKSSKKSRRGGMMKKRRKFLELEYNSNINHNQTGMQQNQDSFGFEPGPEFTLQTFEKYADDFNAQYFKKDEFGDTPLSVEDIEGEYWRIVERPTEEIEVIYGADVETGTFSSGFPKLSPEEKSEVELKYVESGWNLNNLPRLQGSVLSFEGSDISGVLVPWVYVGMCFSSFCWHVEDHHLYSLSYMHWGAPKMWYGVPGKDAANLEAAMRKHLPDLFEEQPDLLHNLVTQFSPSSLKSEGVPVYRCVQHKGEFVLTFPRAYHAGFNCGFNCAEAVNVAPIDWLPIGQDAVALYREQARKITISHDKLLIGAAREAVRAQWDILFLRRNTADNLRWKSMCGPDSTLCKSLKARVEMELVQRQNICSPSQSRKIDAEFDSIDRECAFCYYDLHLSASGCPCCPEKYTCLVHAKQLCSCDWDKRFFLFRYDVNELCILADALGGKLSAIHRWGVSHLGLSLGSCVKREKDQDVKALHRVTDGTRRSYMSLASAVSLAPSLVCNEQNNNGNKMLDTSSLEMNTCPSAEQIEYGHVSLRKESHMKNELSCMVNNSIGQLQYNRVPRGHKISLSFSVPSAQSFSSNFVTKSFTSGESMKNAYGLEVFKERESSSRTRDYASSLVEHHNRLPIIVDHQSNTKPSLQSPNDSHMLMASNTKATVCHSCKDQMCIAPDTNASVMTEKDSSHAHAASSQPSVRAVSRAQSVSQEAPTSVFTSKPHVDISFVKNTYGGLSSESPYLGHPHFVNQRPSDGCLHRKLKTLPSLETRGGSCALVQPARENHNMNEGAQKGPHIANDVHRFKSSVEPLEIGIVLSGRLWSSSLAIFPKGFRSRVKYLSIVDPTQMVYYISEILDVGLRGPLFMVTPEKCPSEVFINVSPTKCWSLVCERLNMEIRRQLGMGRSNLPALQPPGSVDGFEMFGLSSPAIVQAIEARDRDHICTEYWRSRPHVVAEDRDSPLHIALKELFQRANSNELQALRHLLMRESSPYDSSLRQATQILDEEIAKHW